MRTERQHHRVRTYIGARIEQPAQLGTMNCLVRDLTPVGARLEFHNTATVVDRFDLVMPAKDKRIRARIVWRRFGEAGVAFEQQQDVSGADEAVSQSVLERLRTSETRRRRLESQIERLNEIG